MASPEFRQWLRLFFIAGLVGIFLLVSVHFFGHRVSAEALSQPPFQDLYPGTDFPTLEPYPGEEIPTSSTGATASPTVGTATRTPATTGTLPVTVTAGPSQTPVSTLTVTPTEPNVFLTENAEMGGSSVTPPSSPTSEPTETASPTQRPTRTRTPFPAVVSAAGEDGQNLDWGLFWIGFAVPVVMACGVVLYLLDRRPELFSFKRK